MKNRTLKAHLQSESLFKFKKEDITQKLSHWSKKKSEGQLHIDALEQQQVI